jgi:mRNA-degrading endonuclease YafQ of YafQ-DinJ toxin-antitoxin module
MNIRFATDKLEQIANDSVKLDKLCRKQKAHCTADDILEQLNILDVALSIADIPATLRPHPLQGSLKGSFAINVSPAHRIIFRPDHEDDPDFRIDNRNTIKRIVVEELCIDYHKH